MTPERPNPGADALMDRLATVLFSLRLASRADRAGGALFVAACAIAAMIALDAALPLPSMLRAAIALFWLALLARIAIGALLPARSARRAGPLRAARLAEQRLGVAGNALVNAVQLRRLAVSGASFESALASRAVDRAAGALRETLGAPVVDWRPAHRSWLRALAAILILGLGALLAPRLFAMVLPRYAEPFALHPPYTRTEFDITISPESPVVGDSVLVDVALRGPLPRSLDLVLIEGAGRRAAPAARTPLAPRTSSSALAVAGRDAQPASAYATLLRDLREPVRFYIEGSTGRSRIVEVIPSRTPRPTHASLTITPPAYTAKPASTHAVSIAQGESGAGHGFTAIVGSTVEFTVGATLPLESAESAGPGAVAIDGAAATLRATLDAPGETAFSLRPRAIRGEFMPQSVGAVVHAVPDAPPEVAVEAPAPPGSRARMSPGAPIPIRASAADDVAVASFVVEWSIDPAPDRAAPPRAPGAVDLVDARSRAAAADGALSRLARADTVIDTSAWALAPGDSVVLTFIAADNRPPEFGGAQTTAPASIVIDIVEPPAARSTDPASAAASADGADDQAPEHGASAPGAAPEPGAGDGAGVAPGPSADESSLAPGDTPGAAPSGAQSPQAAEGETAAPRHTPGAGDSPESGFLIEGASEELEGPEVGRGGRRHSTDAAPSGDPLAVDAILDRSGSLASVPAAYRDIAAGYLERIARAARRAPRAPSNPPVENRP